MTPWGPAIVYPLCLLASIVCALMLLRAWLKSPAPLLLWSSIAFVFLALNNLLVVSDMLLFERDLILARQAAAFAAIAVLLYGFIWKVRG